jgi:hypothetical protein
MLQALGGVCAVLLAEDEASIEGGAGSAMFGTSLTLALLLEFGAFHFWFVGTQLFAEHILTLGLTPLGGSRLVIHTWLLTNMISIGILRTKVVITGFEDAILETRLETVLLWELLFLRTSLFADIDLLGFLAGGLTHFFFFAAARAVMLARG